MVKLLIVDDSSFMRMAIRKMLQPYEDITIVGEACNGLEGLEKVKSLQPDVVTMDIEMPVMNGLEAIKKIMEEAPRPIIMISSLTSEGSEATLQGLQNGAVDFIPKKSSFVQLDIISIDRELAEKIRYWGKRHRSLNPSLGGSFDPPPLSSAFSHSSEKEYVKSQFKLVVLGISTGGPVALVKLLKSLKKLSCPMVIAQHMPPMFTKSLSNHLGVETGHHVVEGSNGLELSPGMIVIAKGGTDSIIREPLPGRFTLFEKLTPDILLHPCADILFQSAARLTSNIVGVVMTGMGNDGMVGARDLRAKNMPVISQQPETCTVDGMPRSVIEDGQATHVLPIEEIGNMLSKWCGQ